MWRKTRVLAAMIATVLILTASVAQGRTYERGDDVPSAEEFYNNGFRHSPAFLSPPKWHDSKTFSTIFSGNDPWDK